MSSQLINRVVELTNQERAKAGLQPLTLNNQLTQAAQGHSDSMAVDDFFSHTGADGSSVGSRVRDTGYNYATAGENIAAGQRTAEQVVESWMNSPGHRANILNPNYTEIGVGYELLENDRGSVNYNHYWTQVFGSPLGGRRSPATNSQPTETVEQNDESIIENNDKATPSPETDSTPVDSLQPETTGKDSKMPQIDELAETKVPVTEKQDSEIENLDDNTSDLESSDKKDNSSNKGDDFNLFGVDMGDLSGTEGDYGDDLTGSPDNTMMAGSDDAIISSQPKAYSFSYSSSSGGKNSVFTDSGYDFTDISEMMKKSWLGTSESNLSQYESDLIDAISNSDLSSGQQQKMIEAVESFF